MYFLNCFAPALRIPFAGVNQPVRILVYLCVLLPWLSACAVELAQLSGSSFNRPAGATEIASDPRERSHFSKVIVGDGDIVESAHAASRNNDDHTGTVHDTTLSGQTEALLKRYGAAGISNNGSPQSVAHSGQPRNSRLAQRSAQDALPTSRVYTIEAFNAPVEALLFALVNDAGLQLQLNGKLDAQATINAVDQSLDDIMSSLANQAGFSWQIVNHELTVWTGEAYTHSYPINYLNMHRRTQSSVGLATQVGTINASNESGGSIANSSQTRIENISEHHFWDSLLVDIQNVVSQGASSELDTGAGFSINREAGILTARAKPEVHGSLQRYLKVLHGTTQRQVLIEATVVEVALSDNFDAGVDWQVLAKGVSGISAAQVLVGAPLVAAETVDRLTGPAGLVSFVQEGGNNDVRTTLSLLEQFGDVRILSRPRIIALNNQSSVLKVVDNRVYFTVNVQRRQTEDRDEVVTETEIHTVPVGLVMNVTPQISETGMVMLNVRPTLSRILGFVNDPNPELALANVRNGVPEIQVREMESMLQVQSGNVAIIGGLMQETQSDNDAQLPGLGALPVIGRLFKSESRNRRQTELLIVLRPTVLGNSTGAYP